MKRMNESSVISLVAGSVALMSWLASGSDLAFKSEVYDFSNKDEDIGRATKCDSKDPTQVSISWKPKQLSPSGQVEISLFYIAPHDMNGGFMNISLYFHGEQEPFIGYSNKFSCEDVKQYFQCPMRKKFKIAIPRNISNLHALTSFPGDYDAIVDIRNEKNQEMLCLNFTLNVNEI